MWFSTKSFTRGHYQHATEDLNATSFSRFTDNFSLMALRGPELLPDWFDATG